MSIYCVKFDILSDSFRETKHYCFTCFADTAKEAKEQCALEWPKLFNAPGAKAPLRLNVCARKAGIQDVACSAAGPGAALRSVAGTVSVSSAPP